MYKQELLDCHSRIKPHIHRTAVLTSGILNEMSGAELYFKCENFQRMGAYKIRGATNAIMLLPENDRKKGVVTHSSGNFAQALSLAAKNLGIQAHIVMPSNAPKVKRDAVEYYGGNIVLCKPTIDARISMADKIIKETGATFIHPSNDLNVIIGQGTAAKELLEDYPDLNFLIAPVGGGGLIAGSALAAYHFGKSCKVYGGEPFEADDAFRSFYSGKIETNKTTNTIADGLKTVLGDKTFPIIRKYVSDIFRVSEKEIIDAMYLIWERLKIVVEPSSAVAFAAILKEKKHFKNQKVGILISGGNVDLKKLPF